MNWVLDIFKYAGNQFCCLAILLYIGFIFIKDGELLNKKTGTCNCHLLYDWLFILAEMSIFFDGFATYTVNHIDSIPISVNMTVHLLCFLFYQASVCICFFYMLSVVDLLPTSSIKRFVVCLPTIISAVITVCSIPNIRFGQGTCSNYSYGIAVSITFATALVYFLIALIIFWKRQPFLNDKKKTSFFLSTIAASFLAIAELISSELLLSSLGMTLIVVTIYLTMENPSEKNLSIYQNKMVMGFAALVENKDGSTGCHIKRTSVYVKLIAEELRKNSKYSQYMTKDFIDCLTKAAPMHDIGKIGIPESILQKPTKLTKDEFVIMRTHSLLGGKIVKENFGHLTDSKYETMAYEVAMYHHEKWNGRGYPNGLKNTAIPLSARIMAVADVFDAISVTRCYRAALPLETCFKIIADGKGTYFEPVIADAFLKQRAKIEKVFHALQT